MFLLTTSIEVDRWIGIRMKIMYIHKYLQIYVMKIMLLARYWSLSIKEVKQLSHEVLMYVFTGYSFYCTKSRSKSERNIRVCKKIAIKLVSFHLFPR